MVCVRASAGIRHPSLKTKHLDELGEDAAAGERNDPLIPRALSA